MTLKPGNRAPASGSLGGVFGFEEPGHEFLDSARRQRAVVSS